jgi:hypothetical protein
MLQPRQSHITSIACSIMVKQLATDRFAGAAVIPVAVVGDTTIDISQCKREEMPSANYVTSK